MATPTSPILSAVDSFYSALKKKHPELPEIVFVVGSSGRSKNAQTHGHFAAQSWEGGLHEIFLSGESLGRGAVETIGTIAHEAAHALAFTRGVRDCSNQGRFHNGRFKAIAEEIGIEVEKRDTDPSRGFSYTTVPEAFVTKYKRYVDALDKALTTYRVQPLMSVAPKTRTKTKMVVDCSCELPFTISRRVFDERNLVCNDCFEPLIEQEGAE